MDPDQLPHVDEHSVVIAADASAVWDAVAASFDRSFSRPIAIRYAGFLRCEDSAPAGPRPFRRGSAVAGFHVETAAPGRELVLAGRHRLSRYALRFRCEPAGAGRTRLRAETRAAFPGTSGRAYRAVVIGTGGHTVFVRRMLTNVKRQLEWEPPPSG